jgi:dolichol-phosphate mannosyltransferase
MIATARDDVVVVLPTYNEAENLRRVIAAVRAQGVRVLIVDDDSPDGTGAIAESLADGYRVAVLHRKTKQGLGPAYAAGFRRAIGSYADIICEMDADLSHDPNDLPRLIGAVDAGADMALGSRYVPGGGVEDWPWHRRALSRGGNIYAATMLGGSIHDMTSGFRAYQVDALKRLDPWRAEASGYGFQIEMAWRARALGLDIVEVPIIFRDRFEGTSKMDRSIALEAVGLVTKWGVRRMTGRLRLPAGED